jgi:hypothetical protein
MSLNPESLKRIMGKTIAAIVTREGAGAGPRRQFFLIFTDNTYQEFYGDMGWSTGSGSGNVQTVQQYASRFGGNVVVVT